MPRVALIVIPARPLAGDAFLARLEQDLTRRLRPPPAGRPKAWRKKK